MLAMPLVSEVLADRLASISARNAAPIRWARGAVASGVLIGLAAPT